MKRGLKRGFKLVSKLGSGLMIASACLMCACSTASHRDADVATRGDLGPAATGPEATLDEVVALMTGTFTSQAQARQNAEFRAIELHMAPIWTRFSTSAIGQRDPANPRRGHGLGDSPRQGERWLYVEQSMTTATDKPYRQRVYRLSPLIYTDVTGATQVGVRSEVWELPGDPLRYVGAWRSPDPLADIGPESLSLKEGCEVLLFRAVDGAWRGSTVGDACVSKREGAAYTTSMVQIDANGLKTLDRGFDAKGTQVWGSEAGAYEFRREAPRNAVKE